MATACRRNRATFPCRERPRYGTATIFVLRPRPQTGPAEFDRVRGGLGHPRALGAQLQGKVVCVAIIGDEAVDYLPFLSSCSDTFLGTVCRKGLKQIARNFDMILIYCPFGLN